MLSRSKAFSPNLLFSSKQKAFTKVTHKKRFDLKAKILYHTLFRMIKGRCYKFLCSIRITKKHPKKLLNIIFSVKNRILKQSLWQICFYSTIKKHSQISIKQNRSKIGEFILRKVILRKIKTYFKKMREFYTLENEKEKILSFCFNIFGVKDVEIMNACGFFQLKESFLRAKNIERGLMSLNIAFKKIYSQKKIQLYQKLLFFLNNISNNSLENTLKEKKYQSCSNNQHSQKQIAHSKLTLSKIQWKNYQQRQKLKEVQNKIRCKNACQIRRVKSEEKKGERALRGKVIEKEKLIKILQKKQQKLKNRLILKNYAQKKMGGYIRTSHLYKSFQQQGQFLNLTLVKEFTQDISMDPLFSLPQYHIYESIILRQLINLYEDVEDVQQFNGETYKLCLEENETLKSVIRGLVSHQLQNNVIEAMDSAGSIHSDFDDYFAFSENGIKKRSRRSSHNARKTLQIISPPSRKSPISTLSHMRSVPSFRYLSDHS